MIRALASKIANWLGRSEKPRAPVSSVPDTSRIDVLMAEWGLEARRGGPGSDIAAAKALGARTAIMCLAPVQNRAVGWRGAR